MTLAALLLLLASLVGGQPIPQGDIGTAEWALQGRATWYDAPSSKDAAAGPLLREQLGKHWRGSWVSVCHGERCVTVQLTDWCLCKHGRRLVDLDDRAFRRLAPLSKGVLEVVVSSGEIPLPATDTEE